MMMMMIMIMIMIMMSAVGLSRLFMCYFGADFTTAHDPYSLPRFAHIDIYLERSWLSSLFMCYFGVDFTTAHDPYASTFRSSWEYFTRVFAVA